MIVVTVRLNSVVVEVKSFLAPTGVPQYLKTVKENHIKHPFFFNTAKIARVNAEIRWSVLSASLKKKKGRLEIERNFYVRNNNLTHPGKLSVTIEHK